MKKLMLTLMIAATPALTLADTPEFTITIKDHMFSPAETVIPANQQVRLIVNNQDSTPEEFEGENFDIEKIVPGNTQVGILAGPFSEGEYDFVGEFHEDTAKGKLIAQ